MTGEFRRAEGLRACAEMRDLPDVTGVLFDMREMTNVPAPGRAAAVANALPRLGKRGEAGSPMTRRRQVNDCRRIQVTVLSTADVQLGASHRNNAVSDRTTNSIRWCGKQVKGDERPQTSDPSYAPAVDGDVEDGESNRRTLDGSATEGGGTSVPYCSLEIGFHLRAAVHQARRYAALRRAECPDLFAQASMPAESSGLDRRQLP